MSVSARANEADIFLVLSDVKVHYFAGYSNPVKYFVPGICAYETAEQNHSLALAERSIFGVHPWHRDPTRRDNPLAADQFEGMRLIVASRPVYALTTIGAGGRVYWAKFGPAETAAAAAFAVADERNVHAVTPADRLIVSPGGEPNDADLYIAQRGLELTKAAVVDGGEVLFLAACRRGIGEPHTTKNFYERLTAPIEEILNSIKERYVLYSHKPYRLAQLIHRLRRIWVYSQIPAASLTAAHLHPTDDPQTVVDAWLTERPDARILIVDGANKIALRPVAT
jgi:nickel-dependent lactate racemase